MECKCLEQIRREYYKEGFLYAPFHILITARGDIEEERPKDAVGSSSADGHETTITILVDKLDKRAISESQRVALEALIAELKEEYKEAELIY